MGKSTYTLYKFCNNCVNKLAIEIFKGNKGAELIEMRDIEVEPQTQSEPCCNHKMPRITTKALRIVFRR